MNHSKLIKKEMIAEQSLLFTIEKPAGFTFLPGQFVEIKIPSLSATSNSSATEEGTPVILPPHYFSIVSTPADKDLVFLARIRDSVYKNKLMSMSAGEELLISEAAGHWTLANSPTKQVMFIVGGVGSAGVYGMVKDVMQNAKNDVLNKDITPENQAKPSEFHIVSLFSNQSIAATAFYEELYNEWPKLGYSTYFATTRENNNIDRVYSRRVDTIMLQEMLGKEFDQQSVSEVSFYVVGAPEFVIEMRKQLLELGAVVTNIKLDLFTGY
jgi:ferredoxin-NADP reductase